MEKLESIFTMIAFADDNEFEDWGEMDKHKIPSSRKSLKALKNNKCKGGDMYATSK